MTDAGDIIKSGAGEKIADLVNKLAGPLAEEVGIMLGDKVKFYRVKNWIKTVEKTERLLRGSGLPANAVPPRLFLPIMEASSIEDNETLQEMWAGLLATASQESDEISPSFVEALKQLTPNEARLLRGLYVGTMRYAREGRVASASISHYSFIKGPHNPAGVLPDAFERLGLIRREYGLTKEDDSPEIGILFRFTDYAASFMRACEGPKSEEEPARDGRS
jgi:hypothetical protein